jgi:hypothetical protein
MSKHVDLLAIAVLLLAFAFAARVHEVLSLHFAHPIVIRPPHVPPLPRFSHLPRV